MIKIVKSILDLKIKSTSSLEEPVLIKPTNVVFIDLMDFLNQCTSFKKIQQYIKIDTGFALKYSCVIYSPPDYR